MFLIIFIILYFLSYFSCQTKQEDLEYLPCFPLPTTIQDPSGL